MKYMAAFALCVVGGNAAPSAADVTKVVEAAGGEVDADALTVLMTDMEGKDINELLATGEGKFKGMGGGGGASAGDSAAPAAAVVEAPKEEEVDALDGGMDMFGGSAGGGDY